MRCLTIKNIFLHGWGFSSQIWERLYSSENSTFLDLPFHRKNIDYTDNEILESFSSDILQMIDQSEEEVSLVGWSLGATISVLTALKKPEKLKKLILIGFSPKFMDSRLGHNPVFVKAFFLALKTDFKGTVLNFRKLASGKDFSHIPLPQKEGSIKLLREFVNLDLTDRLSQVDIPVYLIHGKKDRVINYQASVFSSGQFKNAHLILTDDNHAPFLKDSGLIRRLV
ncbi:MAG: alpha/beta hydrolase [Persephonella sp.]|nr:alpha/beta hydrolase [Persephonella sp.]